MPDRVLHRGKTNCSCGTWQPEEKGARLVLHLAATWPPTLPSVSPPVDRPPIEAGAVEDCHHVLFLLRSGSSYVGRGSHMWEAYVGTMNSYVGRAKKHTHVERGNHMSLRWMRMCSDNANKRARVCMENPGPPLCQAAVPQWRRL